MLKYWQVLLNKWRAQGNNGLTLPYLIGARNFFITDRIPFTIAMLLTDIAQTRDYETYITYCMDINQLIIGERSGEKTKLGGSFMNLPNGQPSSLFITSKMELGTTLPEAIASLTERHQYHIDHQQYSIIDREWSDFSENEKRFISECAEDLLKG